MSKKPRRKFSEELKLEILESYISGAQSVHDLAREYEVSPSLIYQWRTIQRAKEKRSRIDELSEAGATRAMAIKLQQQEDEIAAYQKKVAEQAVIIDLLKKLQKSKSYQSESELSGLIGTINKSGRKRGPVR